MEELDRPLQNTCDWLLFWSSHHPSAWQQQAAINICTQQDALLTHVQVYGKDFFTGVASCIPAQAAPKQQVMVAKGMAQEMEFALGNALAADVDTSSQV
jgi:hypothetical protein